jgi:hypothetical protein
MEYNTYLSDDDDEIDIVNEQVIELDQYGMPIIEIDEEEEIEIRRIMSNKMLSMTDLNEDIYNGNESPKKNKQFKNPKSKTMSLNDLNNFIDKKIEEKKPKKFISKRMISKKNIETPIKTNIFTKPKRHFNPKLIPYIYSDEYKNSKINNSNILNNLDFPSL